MRQERRTGGSRVRKVGALTLRKHRRFARPPLHPARFRAVALRRIPQPSLRLARIRSPAPQRLTESRRSLMAVAAALPAPAFRAERPPRAPETVHTRITLGGASR